MPRRSRPRPRNRAATAASKWQRETPGGRDISRILDPEPRVERALDGDWHVRYMSAVAAQKTYICPGCGRTIAPATAHVVVWRKDHLFGDRRAIQERRHWHSHCWRTRQT